MFQLAELSNSTRYEEVPPQYQTSLLRFNCSFVLYVCVCVCVRVCLILKSLRLSTWLQLSPCQITSHRSGTLQCHLMIYYGWITTVKQRVRAVITFAAVGVGVI